MKTSLLMGINDGNDFLNKRLRIVVISLKAIFVFS